MFRYLLMSLATATLVATAPPSDRDDNSTVAWLEHHGHRLASAEPTAAELAPLVDQLKNARVIGVGEVTHGTHEDQAFKTALIEALVRAGAIDMLAIEANRSAGTGFDRYVRTGQGDPVALIQSSSFFRIWKGDEFAGLLLWIRAWNVMHPAAMIGIVAIDNQDGSIDAEFALDWLAGRDPLLAVNLRHRFGTLIPPPGEARVRPSDWIAARTAEDSGPALAAATALRDTMAAHPEWQANPGYSEAAYAANAAWQNLDEFRLDVKGAEPSKQPIEYHSRRDRYMAANMLDRLGSSHHAALWAHNLHILSASPVSWQTEGYWTIGLELKRRLGAAYRTVGVTYTNADVLLTRRAIRTSADMAAPPDDQPTVLVNNGPDGAGRMLARLPGDAWWFDLSARGDASAPIGLARPTWLGDVGWMVDPATFQTSKANDDAAPFGMGFDALVWFRTMTPHHRWPTAVSKSKRLFRPT